MKKVFVAFIAFISLAGVLQAAEPDRYFFEAVVKKSGTIVSTPQILTRASKDETTFTFPLN